MALAKASLPQSDQLVLLNGALIYSSPPESQGIDRDVGEKSPAVSNGRLVPSPFPLSAAPLPHSGVRFDPSQANVDRVVLRRQTLARYGSSAARLSRLCAGANRSMYGSAAC